MSDVRIATIADTQRILGHLHTWLGIEETSLHVRAALHQRIVSQDCLVLVGVGGCLVAERAIGLDGQHYAVILGIYAPRNSEAYLSKLEGWAKAVGCRFLQTGPLLAAQERCFTQKGFSRQAAILIRPVP